MCALARLLGKKTLVLAHSVAELLQQTADRMRALWPCIGFGIVNSDEKKFGHHITIASVQTASGSRVLNSSSA